MAMVKPGTYETTVIGGVTYMGLRTWCRVNGLSKNDERFVATTARKHDDNGSSLIVGARQTFGGSWVLPVDTPLSVIPVRGESAITRRPDGRVRFVVYLTDTEYTSLRGKHEIVDLRVKRKQRRAAKKTATKNVTVVEKTATTV